MGSEKKTLLRENAREIHDEGYGIRGRKACRVCDDFTSWRRNKSSVTKGGALNKHDECPLSRDELGRNTWSFLHTMAAYYPEKPDDHQKVNMAKFMHLFSKFYPCDYCAADLRKNMKKSPPNVEGQLLFSQWLCEQHNIVNVRLGKPKFDCSKVFERWKDGWKDGSCD